MTTTHLSLIVSPTDIVAYQSKNAQPWQLIPIHGDSFAPHHQDASHIKAVFEDIAARFNSENLLSHIDISLIYVPNTDGNVQYLECFLMNFQAQQNQRWQILNWKKLLEQACRIAPPPENIEHIYFAQEWVSNTVLPLLVSDHGIEQQQRVLSALASEKKQTEQQLKSQKNDAQQQHQSSLSTFEQEKLKLQQELAKLQQQLSTVKQPELEQLVSYWPVIFKDFWNVVRPDELAAIAGRLTIPQISSPYHSPSVATVQSLKRKFLVLNLDNQQQIIGFCRDLKRSHRLQIHPEFQHVIGELD